MIAVATQVKPHFLKPHMTKLVRQARKGGGDEALGLSFFFLKRFKKSNSRKVKRTITFRSELVSRFQTGTNI